MKFSPAEIEALKRENSVIKVAGAWVALRAHRQGEFPMSGPCPLHSPDPQARDSTSFACSDEAWVCTSCGGGDVIKLVALRNGLDPREDFVKAVELLGGVRKLSEEEARALEEARTEEAAARTVERNEFRDRERAAAWDIYYKYGIRLNHPQAEVGRRYLTQARGLDYDHGLRLRFNAAARYYVPDKPKYRLIHTGPALTGVIQRGGKFAGVHSTFIDLAQPKGKARIIDPKTNELQLAKKVRGSMKGGHVDLTGCADPQTLVLGEGKEKVLAIWSAWRAAGRDLAATAFWSAMNLGNLGGKHDGLVPHPAMKTQTGRVQRVPSPLPDLSAPAIIIPDCVTRLILLGDSTSDRFSTQCVIARAAARYARPGRDVVAAWSPEGKDFDDLLREAS